MSSAAPHVLAVENLRIETLAGDDIVDEVTFNVRAGEVVALVGESGCGKTTTALALLGHSRLGTKITGGTVKLEGVELLHRPASVLRRLRGSRISYVAQDPTSSLNPRIRIGRQIEETVRVHGSNADDAKILARDLAERVGLPKDPSFLGRYPFELSGGQQQRIAIAMALSCKPVVVVLDEPTTGLDVTTQALVLDLLRDLSSQTGAAFVYVTHDLAVVDSLADRAAVMYAGRIVEIGPLDRVFGNPAHPYTSLLLASVPRLSVRQELTGIAGTAPPPGARPSGCFFSARCPLVETDCLATFPADTTLAQAHRVRCYHASTEAKSNGDPRRRALDVNPPQGQALLTVDGLYGGYGRGRRFRNVLTDVSLSIRSGRCLAIVGESGSGKTTLGRCIAGLHRPAGGSIKLGGFQLPGSAAERSREQLRAIQIIFQNPERSLNPTRTVAQALSRPLRLFGFTEHRRERSMIADLLERVRLPRTMLDRYPRELSGGEKQRVAIARALAARPSLLVCDEITSALDVSIQAAIVSLLEGLRADGLTMLFITHNLALVHSIADDVVVLQAGVVREVGPAASVISQPSDPYTQSLLHAALDLTRAAPVVGHEQD